jgi:hypothetical protein
MRRGYELVSAGRGDETWNSDSNKCIPHDENEPFGNEKHSNQYYDSVPSEWSQFLDPSSDD